MNTRGASPRVSHVPHVTIGLDRAIALTRTGDVWLFRGRNVADRAIQALTNSPVNHVGMAVALDDLPPLMWHAELGRSLPDVWTGKHQRGVQLHDLRDAVLTWAHRYGQRAWLRQLDPEVGDAAEDAVLQSIARLDGTPFPSTAALTARWWRGQARSHVPRPDRAVTARLRGRREERPKPLPDLRLEPAAEPDRPTLETAYCAEILASTYQAMGLLPADRSPSAYDPGHFWSGDDLKLLGGHRLTPEIEVALPAPSP